MKFFIIERKQRTSTVYLNNETSDDGSRGQTWTPTKSRAKQFEDILDAAVALREAERTAIPNAKYMILQVIYQCSYVTLDVTHIKTARGSGCDNDDGYC
jgi:hypothetical protein